MYKILLHRKIIKLSYFQVNMYTEMCDIIISRSLAYRDRSPYEQGDNILKSMKKVLQYTHFNWVIN